MLNLLYIKYTASPGEDPFSAQTPPSVLSDLEEFLGERGRCQTEILNQTSVLLSASQKFLESPADAERTTLCRSPHRSTLFPSIPKYETSRRTRREIFCCICSLRRGPGVRIDSIIE